MITKYFYYSFKKNDNKKEYTINFFNHSFSFNQSIYSFILFITYHYNIHDQLSLSILLIG